MTAADRGSVIGTFHARAEEARSTVHALAGWSDVAALALELAGDGRIVLAPSLAAAAPALAARLGSRAELPDARDPVASVADAEVGVVRGALAVAETGSVLLVEGALADRAVSMLSRTLIQVVDRGDVVPALEAVAERLVAGDMAPYASLTTGPSRTADIERSLTIGVQGPSAVHVVIVG